MILEIHLWILNVHTPCIPNCISIKYLQTGTTIADKYSNLSQDVLLKNIVTIDANLKIYI